jgi:hypothetical protein
VENDEIGPEDRVFRGFNKLLNIHGYGFHYAVLGLAERLSLEGKSPWVFEAAEFPVSVQGSSTRIDFVLKKKATASSAEPPFYLIAECKRANPSFSDWCFARAPFVRRNRNGETIIYEHLEIDKSGFLNACGMPSSSLVNAYHIGLELKSSNRGDAEIQGRAAIEEAAGQVSKGLNGLSETLSRLFGQPGFVDRANLLPVIFTTANLWSTEDDLSLADIETGNLELNPQSFRPHDWLVLQYPISPGLKHGLQLKYAVDGLAEMLDYEYVRSIPIVNASGISEFLEWAADIYRY